MRYGLGDHGERIYTVTRGLPRWRVQAALASAAALIGVLATCAVFALLKGRGELWRRLERLPPRVGQPKR